MEISTGYEQKIKGMLFLDEIINFQKTFSTIFIFMHYLTGKTLLKNRVNKRIKEKGNNHKY